MAASKSPAKSSRAAAPRRSSTGKPAATKARASTASAKKPSSAKKPAATKPAATKPMAKASRAAAAEVTVDRRRAGRRAEPVAKAQDQPAAAPLVQAGTPAPAPLERRQKVNRRRQIDPTTCERDYSIDEVEFMNALDDYKRKSGRMFPTCSEVLEVVRGLGYVKLAPAELAARSPGVAGDDSAAEREAREALALSSEIRGERDLDEEFFG